MEGKNNKAINYKKNSIKKENISNHESSEELKYNNRNYNFGSVLSTPIILGQIFKFSDSKDIKNLSLCNKKIYLLYCDNVKSLKIYKEDNILNIIKLFKKYRNINDLDLSECNNLDISLNNNHLCFSKIKKLNLRENEKIQNFNFKFNFENLEILNVSRTSISDISFLEKLNIKELYLSNCFVEDCTPISKLKSLEILDISSTYVLIYHF